MRLLITGAAGNFGSRLARSLLDSRHELRLMVHRRPLPFDVGPFPRVSITRADLGDAASLSAACEGVDCIVHFGGVLFAPRPETFLHRTNTVYVKNLVAAAREAGVRKFILVSFPHVEGETTPGNPARGRLEGAPGSVHARTRLAAEKHLFEECGRIPMTPVVLCAGSFVGRSLRDSSRRRSWLAKRLRGGAAPRKSRCYAEADRDFHRYRPCPRPPRTENRYSQVDHPAVRTFTDALRGLAVEEAAEPAGH